jgi:hypothetical protein
MRLALVLVLAHLAFAAKIAAVVTVATWIGKMKRRDGACACSAGWKREYLFWALMADLLAGFALALFVDRVPALLVVLFVAHEICLLTVLSVYARDLQRARCQCSEGWMREVAQAWPVFRAGMAAGVLQLLGLALVAMASDRGRAGRR